MLVLSASVGQGHVGAARELARRLTARGIQVEVRDYLDALPWVARGVLRDLYQPTVQHAPALFETLFRRLEHDGALRRTADAVCRWAEPEVESWARGVDVVVTTYPLAGQTLGALRGQGRITVPAMTYLTDPAAHATWCHPAVDHHLTVTERHVPRRPPLRGGRPRHRAALRARPSPGPSVPGSTSATSWVSPARRRSR